MRATGLKRAGAAAVLALTIGATAATANTSGVQVCTLNEGAGHIELTLAPPGRRCPNGATPITLGARGPRGPRGRTGATGPQGVAGSPGATGSPGPAGSPGVAGSPGTPGSPGADGTQGPQGVQGPQGIQGPPGIQGQPGQSKSMIGGDPGSVQPSVSPYFTGPFVSRWSTDISLVDMVVPYDATLRNFYVIQSRSQQPGAPQAPEGSDTFIVMKNGVETSVQCFVTVSLCSDLIDTVSFAAGDHISVEILASDGSAARWTAELDEGFAAPPPQSQRTHA